MVTLTERFHVSGKFDWTTIEKGTNVRIKDERGTFRFMKINEKDGSLQCWGGVTGRERYRSFVPERVVIKKVKR
jgi:hypothetical protein